MVLASTLATALFAVSAVFGQELVLQPTSRVLTSATFYSCVPLPTASSLGGIGGAGRAGGAGGAAGAGQVLAPGLYISANITINVYVVAYVNVCPGTGICTPQYTLTQTCTSTNICDPPATPPGFTITTKPCGCAANTIVTVTEPCSNTAAALLPAPTGQSGSSPALPNSGSNSGSGSGSGSSSGSSSGINSGSGSSSGSGTSSGSGSGNGLGTGSGADANGGASPNIAVNPAAPATTPVSGSQSESSSSHPTVATTNNASKAMFRVEMTMATILTIVAMLMFAL